MPKTVRPSLPRSPRTRAAVPPLPTRSVFAGYQKQAYPHRFEGTLLVQAIAGGVPANNNVLEGWLKSKLGADPDDRIRGLIADIMVERGIGAEEAAEELAKTQHLNVFRRDPNRNGELYIGGYQLKAAIKEGASVAAACDKLPMTKWGKTNKNIFGFVAEHIIVVEDKLYLGVTEPTGINQRFVQTFRGSGLRYEEYVEEAKIDFTIASDYDFSDKEWALLWLTSQEQGIGASRPMGFGRYEVVRWDRV